MAFAIAFLCYNCCMIKEIIVVEGKNDTRNLKQYFECDTIETGGSSCNEEVLELIEIAAKKRGIIVFTDPDSPGERIRNIVNNRVPGSKNAFLFAKDCRDKHKVGIEHASKEVLENALIHCMTYTDEKGELEMKDLIELGLSGSKDSDKLREQLGAYFYFGKCNAKTCLKRCNMLHLTREDLIRGIECLNK